MSTLKADAVTTKSDNTDLTITGGGTGVPNLESGFKVGGTVGVPISGLQVGTDGELITWDASGDPAAVAVGTATHVLTSNGAGAAPTFQAAAGGGAWTLIGTQVASNSASLTQTGLSSTFDSYAIALQGLTVQNDYATLKFRVGDSGGVDSGSTDYESHSTRNSVGSASYSGDATVGATEIRLDGGATSGNAAGEGFSAMLFLNAPGDSGIQPIITGHWAALNPSTLLTAGTIIGVRSAVITLDRVHIILGNSGGNLVTGRMTVWGISHD